jgi:modulator of FtsH protease
MPGWDNFFMTQVGASAGLAGLVFVGVSLNLTKILSSGYLPNRAQEALLVLLLNLVISSLFLVPGQTAASLGGQVLAAGLLAWFALLFLHADSFRRMDAEFRRRSVTAAGMGQAMAISIWAAGAVLLWRGAVGVYWLVPGLLLSYVVALANAWVLTIEINR